MTLGHRPAAQPLLRPGDVPLSRPDLERASTGIPQPVH